MANDPPSIPGLDDPIPVSERSTETGIPEYMIVERIESGVIDGVKHDGTWYVERRPQPPAQDDADRGGSAASLDASSPAGDASDPPQAPRPLSLSIIGWWLTVSGVLSVLGLTAASNPAVRATWERMGIDPTLAVISSLVTGVAHAVAGAGILRGRSWARTFYLWFGAASLVAGVFLFYNGLPAFLLSASVYAVAVYFLTRDAARAYLEDDYEISPESARRRQALAAVRTSQRTPSDLKRVFGVLFAAGAGLDDGCGRDRVCPGPDRRRTGGLLRGPGPHRPRLRGRALGAIPVGERERMDAPRDGRPDGDLGPLPAQLVADGGVEDGDGAGGDADGGVARRADQHVRDRGTGRTVGRRTAAPAAREGPRRRPGSPGPGRGRKPLGHRVTSHWGRPSGSDSQQRASPSVRDLSSQGVRDSLARKDARRTSMPGKSNCTRSRLRS